MQQQATPSMMPVMPSFSPANITTEQIQKYLDENKKLILAIMDNQNLGKLAECAQFQAQLQKNLMYLAAIADAQPQVAAVAPQMAPHPAMQQGAYYMQQQQQAAAMSQQPGSFSPRMPSQAQFNSPIQMHGQQQLHQQHQPMVPGQMNFRPAPTSHPTPTGTSDARRPNMQEGPEAGSSAPSGAEGEQSHLKGPEEGK